MNASNPDRATGREKVRRVVERLVRGGTAVARSDGSVHRLFPAAVTPAEGESLRDWVIREQATQTLEIRRSHVRSGVRRREPPVRPRLPRPCLPRAPRRRGRRRFPRRLPAARRREGRLLLPDESRLDARRSVAARRPPPVGRPPHLPGPGQPTVRLLRRLLTPRLAADDCASRATAPGHLAKQELA